MEAVIEKKIELKPEDERLVQRFLKAPNGEQKRSILRFVPSKRQYGEGGVTVKLKDGGKKYFPNGEFQEFSSEFKDVPKAGYVPANEWEARRMVQIARMPETAIVLAGEEEMEPETRSAVVETARMREELERKDGELAEAKAEIERLKAGKR